MSIDIYIFQSFLSVKKSRDEKLKRNPFIISVPLQPPPWAGPRVKHYCLRCSFWLLVVVRYFSPFFCLSWFLSVWKYPNALCNCIAICCIKPVYAQVRASYHGLNQRFRRRYLQIFGPSCFTKFTLVLKINEHHCQLVQFGLLLCGDTACKN